MKQSTSKLGLRSGAISIAFLVSTLGASVALGQAPVAVPAAPGAPVAPPPNAAPVPVVGATPMVTEPTTAPAAPGDVGVGGQPSPPVAAANAPQVAPPPVAMAVPYGTQLSQPRVIAAPLAVPEPLVPVPPKTRYPFALFFDVAPLWQTSRGYDLFSDNDISTRIGLTAEVDVLEVSKQSFLSVDLSGSFENATDTVLAGANDWSGEALDTDFSSLNADLGLRLRKDFCSAFGAHVVAMGGASRVTTNFEEGTASKQWVPMGHLGGGVTLTLPSATKVRPGLLVEGGYVLSGAADLTLKRDAGKGALSQVNTDLGTLERSGPYLRFALFARY